MNSIGWVIKIILVFPVMMSIMSTDVFNSCQEMVQELTETFEGTKCSQIRFQRCKSVVPNPRAADQNRSVGQLVSGPQGQKPNLHFFQFHSSPDCEGAFILEN